MADSEVKFEEWVTAMETAYAAENLERLTGGRGSYRIHNVACWWMAWQAAFEAGMRAGEIARKKLGAIVEGALAAEGMLSPCSICRPSDEHRHEENCPILDAERFLSKAALPAAPEEKKLAISGAEESKKEKA